MEKEKEKDGKNMLRFLYEAGAHIRQIDCNPFEFSGPKCFQR